MKPILELDGITKIYPGVIANHNITFDLQEGEIHAVCGENGAGKSTLMKIIFGMEEPSRGRIILRGEPAAIASPQEAIKLGIGMVHQHFMLVPSFTVAQNLVLGIEPSKFTRINHQEAIRRTREIAGRYNLQVEPEAIVADITVGMRQKLEILKALYRGARILILDEPTAVLTPQETEELFEELLLLKEKGHTIVFISHKLDEVKQISDRITVIRKGEVTGRFITSEVSKEDISEAMIGRLILNSKRKEKPTPGQSVLKVMTLTETAPSGKKLLDQVSFELKEGEVLGIAGVEGNGQGRLIRILTGQHPVNEGAVSIGGQEINPGGIGHIRSLGVAYIPEDRMKQGSVLEGTVWENLAANRIESPDLSRGAFLDKKRITAYSEALVDEYSIQCPDVESVVSFLSGGNIQKIVVARESSGSPILLIADQPTRGVDVGAAELIHKKIAEMSRKGTAVLMVSADLTELLENCTSLLVMFEGRITARFDSPADLDEKELGYYMLGLKTQEEQK